MDHTLLTPALARTLLSRLAEAWRDADPTIRALLTAELAASTGLHPTSLERLVSLWAETAMLSDLQAFQEQMPAGWLPIGTVAIVAPGNMPVATWQLLMWSWLSGNRVQLRPSRGDPHAARNLWRGLVEVAARAGLALDPTEWLVEVPGDPTDPRVASALLDGAGALVVMGGDAAVAAWAETASRSGFQGPIRGHDARHSAALVGPDMDLAACARLLAHDALLADGRGCLSLRTVLCVGHPPAAVHEALANALRTAREQWPPGQLAPQLVAERQLLADELTMRAALGEQVLVARWSDALLVTALPAAGLQAVGPGSRTLWVVVLPSWEAAVAWLGNQPRCTALALDDSSIAHPAIAAALARKQQTGMRLALSPFGRLQAPSLARWPDGVAPWYALQKPPV